MKSILAIPVKILVCAVLVMVLFEAKTMAAQLTWDPLFNGGTSAGSGNWDTNTANTNWYNGTGDVAWTQTSTTSPTQGATFDGPDAAPGTYQVTNDLVQIAVSNLTINNNGYVFSGANPIYLGANELLSVAPGKTVTFNCNITGSGTSPFWVLGSGSTMNVSGSILSGQQVRLAGPANSAFNLTGPANNPTIMFILAPVNMTGGALTAANNFFIGYTDPATINGIAYTAGSLTMTNATLNENSGIFIISRAFGGSSGGQGTFTIQNGSTVNIGTSKSENLDINYDGSVSNVATVNMQGGTMTVGGTGFTSEIAFFASTGASSSSSTATLYQTGGTISTLGGIVLGNAGGVGTSTLINSGGTLYVGTGISKGASYTGPFTITLSGGTVGALGNWSSSLPMTLTTTNGNITFQCADSGGNPHTIMLSGALSGSGGLNVTGNSGTLDLVGANTYTGTTAVSNGTLEVATSGMATNGPVIVDASTGSSTLQISVVTPGQYWSIGNLTYSAGTPTSDFEFGALQPSTSVAPVQVTGSVTFTATPNVTVGGSGITTGTYPLISYTSAVSGALPTTPTINITGGGSASGYLTNNTSTKTISLVVTSSTVSPELSWAVGNGVWDINTTANWKQFGSSAKYADGDAVLFDDSASGPSPITVTLNTVVNPLNVTFNNAAPTNYTISGSGSINGSASVSVLNSGTATLSGTNTYSGGTTVSAGQLNINNGGNASATAIGTGPLTLNAGASLDNTSGANVTLQASINENWNGSFAYVGSSNSLNTGAGSVTMNASLTISNGGNNFIVGGAITDNNNNYVLTKTGSGALTLPVPNSFGGGLNLMSGLLNLGDPGAAGSGVLAISGGSIDNISGAEFALTTSSTTWGGNFTFVGSTNLDFLNQVNIPNGLGSITVNMAANMLVNFADVDNNNTAVVKTGSGTWQIAGASHGAQSLGLYVNAGEVILNKFGGQAITGGNNVGMTVETGALVVDSNNFQIHSDSPIPLPITLSGGTYDLNGFNENLDELFISAGGTLKMGAPSGTSTLNLISGYTASLTGPCQFYVESNGVLTFQGPVGGGGSLVKTGAGTLNLISNNVYTGATVISNGTLALPAAGTIDDTDNINLATTNAALDLSSNNSPTFTLLSGQMLSGFGSVTGVVQTASGSIVAPGSPGNVGTLTIVGSNTLGGTTFMKLDKTARTNDQLAVTGTLAYGGTLALTNISGTLSNGDSFTLFTAGGGLSGSFTNLSPSRPGYPGFGLAWNTNTLSFNGKVSVVTALIPPPPKITSITLSGTTLAVRGTNGLPNEPFVLLESTNAAANLTNWVQVLSTNFDGSGNFNVSLSTTNAPQEFFAVWEQ